MPAKKTAAKKPAPKIELKRDKKAIKILKRVEKQVRRFLKHVGNHRDNIRVDHAKQLLEIVKEMRTMEKSGWTDL